MTKLITVRFIVSSKYKLDDQLTKKYRQTKGTGNVPQRL